MSDEGTVGCVAEVMARRVAHRLGPLPDDDARRLEHRLVDLDGWTLATLLRVTADRPGAAEPPESRHLGVVGVDHSLNQLVVEERADPAGAELDLEAMDLEALDDEDLIAAAHYVPETLPGYVLG